RFTEADIIRGAVEALKDVNGMLDAVATAPAKAIKRFAEFGEDFTDTFNHRLSNVYGNDALRPLSSMVSLEASRAIDTGFSSKPPQAILSTVTRTYRQRDDRTDCLEGVMPPRNQGAVAQTLANLSKEAGRNYMDVQPC